MWMEFVYKLSLELNDRHGMKLVNRQDLELAGAGRGIIREVLVPGRMRLSDLHFLIQRLFGWRNIHLHSFRLGAADFSWVTEGSRETLLKLGGVLFRIPGPAGFSWIWHKKYGNTRLVRHRNFSLEDSYILNRMRALSPGAAACYGPNANILLERIKLMEILTLRERTLAGADERERWKETMDYRIAVCAERLKQLRADHESEYMSAISALRSYQSIKSDYMDLIELRDLGNDGLDQIIAEHEDSLARYAAASSFLAEDLAPGISPAFDRIFYRYDSGDEWCVSVSCDDIITMQPGGEDIDSQKPEGHGVLMAAKLVADMGEPVCIRSEGYDLVDDIGGVEGYFSMLRALRGEQSEWAGALRQTAAVYGWKARNL